MPERPPALSTELVRDFVSVAHGDLTRVTQLLQQEPALINAAWDWGGGDFETALGAAAHMGRRDIALYLLERGARFDVFAAAMLGQLEAVRAALSAHPALRATPGAHGLSLLHHARQGGTEAQAVVEYFQKEGIQ